MSDIQIAFEIKRRYIETSPGFREGFAEGWKARDEAIYATHNADQQIAPAYAEKMQKRLRDYIGEAADPEASAYFELLLLERKQP